MSKELKILTEHFPNLKHCFIAGGALTSVYCNREINDFDIYVKSKKHFYEVLKYFNDWHCVSNTRRSVSFIKTNSNLSNSIKCQVVVFDEFPTAQSIFDTFDFTCCMAALDLDTKKFSFHERFFQDNLQKNIVFNTKTKFPFNSATRLNKYQQKGYTVSSKEIYKILIACQKLGIDSWEEFEKQLTGFYGYNIKIDYEEEFSWDSAIEKLETLEIHETLKESYIPLDDILVKYDYRTYYRLALGDRNLYSLSPDFSNAFESSLQFENVVDVDKNDIYKKFSKVYKVVRKDTETGELSSIYKPSFKYPLGGTVNGGKHGIYVYSKDTVLTSKYMHGYTPKDTESKVLIEIVLSSESEIIKSILNGNVCPGGLKNSYFTITEGYIYREITPEKLAEELENERH